MAVEDKMISNWQWRPAAMFDLGSIARFGDSDHKHESWCYGILQQICKDASEDSPTGFIYMCKPGPEYDEDSMPYFYCQIQYDAEELP